MYWFDCWIITYGNLLNGILVGLQKVNEFTPIQLIGFVVSKYLLVNATSCILVSILIVKLCICTGQIHIFVGANWHLFLIRVIRGQPRYANIAYSLCGCNCHICTIWLDVLYAANGVSVITLFNFHLTPRDSIPTSLSLKAVSFGLFRGPDHWIKMI